MKITYSPLVADVHGPIGKHSYYDLGGQHIVRGLPVGVPDPSADQLAVRSAYGRLVECLGHMDDQGLVSYTALAELHDYNLLNGWIAHNIANEVSGDPLQFVLSNSDELPPQDVTAVTQANPARIWVTWDRVTTLPTWQASQYFREVGTNFIQYVTTPAYLVSSGGYSLLVDKIDTAYTGGLLWWDTESAEFVASTGWAATSGV